MSFSRDWTRYGMLRVAGCSAICRKASSSSSVSFGGRIWSILRICAYGSHDQAGFVRPDDDSEGVVGSRSKIRVCSPDPVLLQSIEKTGPPHLSPPAQMNNV